MIKYAVRTETIEFNPMKYHTPEDAFYAYDDHYDTIVGIYDTLEEAREALSKVMVCTHVYSSKLASATVAFIDEADFEPNYNGVWEFVSGSDYWDFKYEPLPEDEDE